MANSDCKMGRGLNILLGLFFGFLSVGLLLVGITYLPIVGIFLAAVSFVIAFLFLFAPRDQSCYLAR